MTLEIKFYESSTGRVVVSGSYNIHIVETELICVQPSHVVFTMQLIIFFKNKKAFAKKIFCAKTFQMELYSCDKKIYAFFT